MPIALFVVAACFVFGVVIRCAMKLLPCEILGGARKSRQHVVFERCPQRCPNDARPDGSRPAKSKGMPGSPTVRLAGQAPHTTLPVPQLSGVAPPTLVPHYPPCFHAPRAAHEHLTLPAHIVMLGPHVKRKGDGAERPFQKMGPADLQVCSSLAGCRVLSVFLFRWGRYTLAAVGEKQSRRWGLDRQEGGHGSRNPPRSV